MFSFIFFANLHQKPIALNLFIISFPEVASPPLSSCDHIASQLSPEPAYTFDIVDHLSCGKTLFIIQKNLTLLVFLLPCLVTSAHLLVFACFSSPGPLNDDEVYTLPFLISHLFFLFITVWHSKYLTYSFIHISLPYWSIFFMKVNSQFCPLLYPRHLLGAK